MPQSGPSFTRIQDASDFASALTWAGVQTFSTGIKLSLITSSLLKTDGTGVVAAAVAGTDYATPASLPIGANPSASVGLSAVNGSASTFMRSDGAPALSQSITPTWSASHIFQAGIVLGVAGGTGATVAATAPASGVANHLTLTASAAVAGAGGNVVLLPTANVTSGSPGVVVVRQPGGTPGTHEIQAYHDGTHGYVVCKQGALQLQAGASVRAVYFNDSTSSTYFAMSMTAGDFRIASTFGITWNSVTNATAASTDLGLYRSAASILKITNGSSGYGALICGAPTSSTVGLTLNLAASQSANAVTVLTSASATVFSVGAAGDVTTAATVVVGGNSLRWIGTASNNNYTPLTTSATESSLNCTGSLYINIDSDNSGTTDAIIFGRNSTNTSATEFCRITEAGALTLTQQVATTGSPTALTVTGGAHTTLTASTECIGANFNFSATKQFATGALTTQREVVIQAPTLAFVGASTLTTAVTLDITGAPIAGTNATITNPWAIRAGGGIRIGDGADVVGFGTAATTALYVTLNGQTDCFLRDSSGDIVFRFSAGPAGSGTYLGSATNHPFSILTNNTARVYVENDGRVSLNGTTVVTSTNVHIPATSGFEALKVLGAANQRTLRVKADTTTGQSYGIVCDAGTNSSDEGFVVRDSSGGTSYLSVRGDGAVSMRVGSASGVGLTLNLAASQSANALDVKNSGAVAYFSLGALYDAGTNAVVNMLTLGHGSSGTPAAGFGVGVLLNLNSSTTANQAAGRLTYEWSTATHASRKALSKWTVYDTAEREAIRIEASGTAAMIGLFGVAAVIQPASANQAALSLDVDVTGTDLVDKAAINTNFTALQTLVNQLRTDLVAVGVIKGAA